MEQTTSIRSAAKKKTGRPKGSKDLAPRPSRAGTPGAFTRESFQAKDEGKTAQFLRFALEGYNLPPVDISDPKQVEDRILYYFQRCIDEDHRPGVVGLCNYLGIDKQTWYNWLNGTYRASGHLDLAKRAHLMMETMWEDYMLNGQINPVTGIFMGKNHYGYQDKQEVVVSPKNPAEEGSTPEEIRARYVESVVSDPAQLPGPSEELPALDLQPEAVERVAESN